MFSVKEKQQLAALIEKALMDLDHPEMPKARPRFMLKVQGKGDWSWAEIMPNWMLEGASPHSSPWNEHAREVLDG